METIDTAQQLDQTYKMMYTQSNLLTERLKCSLADIERLCDRWKILELAVFGSVLRDDFREDSDIDILITFQPQPGWSLLDLVDLKAELESLFERSVDIVQKKNLKNPYCRQAILDTYQVIFSR